MVRRIVVELGDGEGMDGLAHEIVSMAMSRIGSNAEFSVRQELVPDREGQKQISIPEFLKK